MRQPLLTDVSALLTDLQARKAQRTMPTALSKFIVLLGSINDPGTYSDGLFKVIEASSKSAAKQTATKGGIKPKNIETVILDTDLRGHFRTQVALRDAFLDDPTEVWEKVCRGEAPELAPAETPDATEAAPTPDDQTAPAEASEPPPPAKRVIPPPTAADMLAFQKYSDAAVAKATAAELKAGIPLVSYTSDKAAQKMRSGKTKAELEEAYQAALAEGPAHMMRRGLAKVGQRLHGFANNTSRWTFQKPEFDKVYDNCDLMPLVTSKLNDAQKLLAEVSTLLNAVPKGWQPVKKAVQAEPAGELAQGTLVCLRDDKARAKYEGVLTPEEMTGLTVQSSNKSQVVVKTVSGDRLILPRGLLALSGAPATETAPQTEDGWDAEGPEGDEDMLDH